MGDEELGTHWVAKVRDKQFCMSIPEFVEVDDDIKEIPLEDLKKSVKVNTMTFQNKHSTWLVG